MRILKHFVWLAMVALLMIFVACGGSELIDPFDPEEQLAEDIDLIEGYIADKGWTDYDTLDNEVRVIVLEAGDGGSIE